MKPAPKVLTLALVCASLRLGSAFAQAEVNLDDLGAAPAQPPAQPAAPSASASPQAPDSGAGGSSSLDDVLGGPSPSAAAPAPVSPPAAQGTAAPARSRLPKAGPAAALGAKVNLYADFDLQADTPMNFSSISTLGFLQNHSAILIKALYGGDQASMTVDALHADQYFELGVKASLFGKGLDAIPILGTSSWRFGRILVPFGDFEFHHLYGGYVDESNILFSKLWSDLGVSWKATLAEGLDAEFFLGNGFASAGDNPSFLPQTLGDADFGKALDLRLRWTPSPASYIMGSVYFDPWGAPGESGRYLYFTGLDLGDKFGPLGLKAGGFWGQVFGARPKDYFRHAEYFEVKYDFDAGWALRLRGGYMDPDSRVRDIFHQADVNLALLWAIGPLSFEFMYYFNQEIYHLFDPAEPNNYHQLLLKCLLTI